MCNGDHARSVARATGRPSRPVFPHRGERCFQNSGINGGQGDKLHDLHRVGLRRLELLQLERRELHILILGDLIPLHQLVILDVTVTRRAKSPLLNTTATDTMYLIEVNILLLNGRINAHRDGHETKGDMRAFQLTSHR